MDSKLLQALALLAPVQATGTWNYKIYLNGSPLQMKTGTNPRRLGGDWRQPGCQQVASPPCPYHACFSGRFTSCSFTCCKVETQGLRPSTIAPCKSHATACCTTLVPQVALDDCHGLPTSSRGTTAHLKLNVPKESCRVHTGSTLDGVKPRRAVPMCTPLLSNSDPANHDYSWAVQHASVMLRTRKAQSLRIEELHCTHRIHTVMQELGQLAWTGQRVSSFGHCAKQKIRRVLDFKRPIGHIIISIRIVCALPGPCFAAQQRSGQLLQPVPSEASSSVQGVYSRFGGSYGPRRRLRLATQS